ncbi:hypothetical protein [Streptomyces sp. NPDC020747]|uniref:hypothetical protein n=1 Tax=Streptomyces sp. NPDC020747 TaxID=3365086 RepID=UPI00378AE5BC
MDDRVSAELAKEVLELLPRLVGADAPRIAGDIHRALAASARTGGTEELRRALHADLRVRSWVEARLCPPYEQSRLPVGSGYQPLAGGMMPATSATRFICKNPACASPDTWTRGFMGEPVPRCSGCTRPLSRET